MAEEGWEEKENCTKGAVEDFRLSRTPPPPPLSPNQHGWLNKRSRVS